MLHFSPSFGTDSYWVLIQLICVNGQYTCITVFFTDRGTFLYGIRGSEVLLRQLRHLYELPMVPSVQIVDYTSVPMPGGNMPQVDESCVFLAGSCRRQEVVFFATVLTCLARLPISLVYQTDYS